MKSVYDIIQQLNEENGSNHKKAVLKEHADNELLQRVLKMAYDSVAFTYGITLKNIDPDINGMFLPVLSLTEALDVLEEEFVTRVVSGNAAHDLLETMLKELSFDNASVLRAIITRDLRINLGRTNINKVFKGLIIKPVYMRCGLYNKDTRKKINPKGAYVQLKADGTYREFTVIEGAVEANSRSGEEYVHQEQFDYLADKPDGKFIGELTVHNKDGVLPRAIGNGIIKSGKVPEGHWIVFDAWDYVTLEEYANAANKIKGTTPYHERFARLTEIIATDPDSQAFKAIETHIVNSFAEGLALTVAWMEAGLEGAIMKDANAIFRDGTSAQQLKLKLEIDADVRITGFKPGTIGTKREGKIGSLAYVTDDGKVKGFVSGFSDKELDDMDSRRDEILNAIASITCNDITQARGNDHFALSHPRFNEIRTDKDTTDTLERILDSKRMAMEIGE